MDSKQTFYCKVDDVMLKTTEQKDQLVLSSLKDGYYILGQNELTNDECCLIGYEQRLTECVVFSSHTNKNVNLLNEEGKNNNDTKCIKCNISYNDKEGIKCSISLNDIKKKEVANLIVKNCQALYLPVSNHMLSFFIQHSLSSLFNILIKANELLVEDTEMIEFCIFKEIKKLFNPEWDDKKKIYTEKDYKSKKILYNNRNFAAGKKNSKVLDNETRNMLNLLPENRRPNYPDQSSNSNNNNNNGNTVYKNYIYDYPLVFYMDKVFPKSFLELNDHYLNLDNIKNIVNILDQLRKEELKLRIINLCFDHPETSGLVVFPQYRNLVSDLKKAKAFHYQLIIEQMASSFSNNLEWNQLKPQIWTLDDLQDIEVNSFQPSWYLDQIYKWDFFLYSPFNFNNCTYKVPDNQKATELFHKKFCYGLLDFDDPKTIDKFYGNNLVIGGSAFSFCACVQEYDKKAGLVNLLSDTYQDSDIDCPILAGDGVFLSTDDLKLIVEEKLAILQNSYPKGWNFRIIQKDKKFQIKNDYINRTLEFFSIPFSKENVWKHYAKYHFGFVRGWFDGYKWNILPSGVISVLTRISIDIRYCSSVHAPQELIWKYIKRKLYPCLNNQEFRYLNLYLANKYQTRWPISNSIYYAYPLCRKIVPQIFDIN